MRLDVKNLDFGYAKKVQILHNINFSAESGQLVSLIGPNGSGKTTKSGLVLVLMENHM